MQCHCAHAHIHQHRYEAEEGVCSLVVAPGYMPGCNRSVPLLDCPAFYLGRGPGGWRSTSLLPGCFLSGGVPTLTALAAARPAAAPVRHGNQGRQSPARGPTAAPGLTRTQVCAAIWDSQGSLQNAGEASGAQLLMLNASQVAGLDPLVLAAPGTDPGVRRRSLLAGPAAAAGAPVVECDGRIQVTCSL